jgi:GNAT superfamily N-acetyltransferase
VIVVRPIAAGDRPVLRPLFLASRRQAFHWLSPDQFNLADFDAQTDEEEIWVAELKGKIEGFAAIWVPDNFIHHLYVAPDHHREGIGEALLDACLGYYGKPLTLKCLKRNENALAFYTAQGWKPVDEGGDDLGEYMVLQLD